MLLGLLLKQVFIVLLVSLLVMCYGLVMATDLGWGLQMILLALFTVALFIYRKPFANLFASVNANTFTSRMVSDAVNSRVLEASANVLPPVAYMKAQKWGLNRAPQLAAAAAAVPAGAAATTGAAATAEAADAAGGDTAAEAEGDGGATATESGGRARARGAAGYGRSQGRAAPPPLNLDGSAGSAARSGAAPQRDSSQAPRLSTAASAGGGLFEGTGGGASSSAIPPRPSGGYTGVGDTGWSSVFGTGSSGNAHRAEAPARSSGDAAPPRLDSSASGTGLFGGRTETPPQGSTLPRPSRWAGPGTRGEKRTPPPARPAPAPAPSERSGGDGDTWLTGSRKDSDAPISPFWTGDSARRDRTRDVPFWLDSDD